MVLSNNRIPIHIKHISKTSYKINMYIFVHKQIQKSKKLSSQNFSEKGKKIEINNLNRFLFVLYSNKIYE